MPMSKSAADSQAIWSGTANTRKSDADCASQKSSDRTEVIHSMSDRIDYD